MKKHFRNIGLPAASLLGMLIGGYTPQAYAGPTLSFAVDGGPALSCADNAACDMNPAAGAVVYIASLGGVFDVNVTTGITKPVLPGSHLDLNSINIQAVAGGPHSLSIMFSETDFTFLNVSGVAGFGGTISNGSTVTASAYFDDTTNALFNLATLIGTTGSLSGPVFAAAFTGPGPMAAPYSITQVLTVSTTGSNTSFSGDFELTMVPEPASVLLLGGALLLVTTSIRKKFRRQLKSNLGNSR